MDRTPKSIFWIVVFICALSAFAHSPNALSETENRTSSISLDTGWQYRWQDGPKASESWTDHEYPQWFFAEPGTKRTLWQRVKLPTVSDNDTIFVEFPWQFFEVFLDDKKIYSNHETTISSSGEFLGYSWHYVPITSDASNKYLYFRIQSNDKYYGIYKSLRLGSKADHMVWMFAEDKARGLFFAVYLFLAVVSLFIYIRVPSERINLAFGMFVVGMGIYSICATHFRQLLTNTPVLWGYLELLSVHFSVIAFCGFLECLFGSGPYKLIRRFWQFGVLLVTYHLVDDLLLGGSLWSTLIQEQLFILVVAATTLPWISYLAIKKNVEARLFMVGITAVGLGTVYDVLNSLGYFEYAPFVNHFTTLVFVFSITNIMLNRYFLKIRSENINLEEMVEARTNELTEMNQELTDEMKQRVIAEEKWREEHAKVLQNAKVASLGQMAAGIAHEINNPLQIVSGSAQMLRKITEENKNAATTKQLDRIEKMVHRIAGISNALLVFSQNDYNRASVKLDVRKVLEEAMGSLKGEVAAANVQLYTSGMLNPVNVVSFPGYLMRVFKTVLENAIYAAKGQGDAWVHVELLSEGERAVIKISDSGQGIDGDMRDKVFEPFFTTKEIGEGVGLGLSVAKGIIESEDGTITLDSESENTTFVMELPEAS